MKAVGLPHLIHSTFVKHLLSFARYQLNFIGFFKNNGYYQRIVRQYPFGKEYMSSILGVVCARCDSKRLPGKNLKKIDGISLIERAVVTLAGSRIDKIVLATDFEPPFDLGRYKAQWIYRPSNVSGDKVPLQETVKWVYNSLGEHYDYIVFLMPNCPGITSTDVDANVEILTGGSKMNVVRSYSADGHENGIIGVRTKYLLDHYIDVYCGAVIAAGSEIHDEQDYLKMKKEMES